MVARPAARNILQKTERATGSESPQETSKQTAADNKAVTREEISHAPLPTIAELIHGKRLGPRTRPAFWGLGAILMSLLLVGQWMYFNRNELARDKQWATYVQYFCAAVHCQIRPRQDVGLVELTDTRVAPHPKFDKALSVRATLINRAKFTQPFPLMEITLTDTEGKVLARKRFNATEYMKNETQISLGLAPNVAHKAQLEITSPKTSADGYEIRLLPSV